MSTNLSTIEYCKECGKDVEAWKSFHRKRDGGFEVELSCNVCGHTIEFWDYDERGNRIEVQEVKK